MEEPSQEVRRILVNNTVQEALDYLAMVSRTIGESSSSIKAVIGGSYKDMIRACDHIMGMEKTCDELVQLKQFLAEADARAAAESSSSPSPLAADLPPRAQQPWRRRGSLSDIAALVEYRSAADTAKTSSSPSSSARKSAAHATESSAALHRLANSSATGGEAKRTGIAAAASSGTAPPETKGDNEDDDDDGEEEEEEGEEKTGSGGGATDDGALDVTGARGQRKLRRRVRRVLTSRGHRSQRLRTSPAQAIDAGSATSRWTTPSPTAPPKPSDGVAVLSSADGERRLRLQEQTLSLEGLIAAGRTVDSARVLVAMAATVQAGASAARDARAHATGSSSSSSNSGCHSAEAAAAVRFYEAAAASREQYLAQLLGAMKRSMRESADDVARRVLLLSCQRLAKGVAARQQQQPRGDALAKAGSGDISSSSDGDDEDDDGAAVSAQTALAAGEAIMRKRFASYLAALTVLELSPAQVESATGTATAAIECATTAAATEANSANGAADGAGAALHAVASAQFAAIRPVPASPAAAAAAPTSSSSSSPTGVSGSASWALLLLTQSILLENAAACRQFCATYGPSDTVASDPASTDLCRPRAAECLRETLQLPSCLFADADGAPSVTAAATTTDAATGNGSKSSGAASGAAPAVAAAPVAVSDAYFAVHLSVQGLLLFRALRAAIAGDGRGAAAAVESADSAEALSWQALLDAKQRLPRGALGAGDSTAAAENSAGAGSHGAAADDVDRPRERSDTPAELFLTDAAKRQSRRAYTTFMLGAVSRLADAQLSAAPQTRPAAARGDGPSPPPPDTEPLLREVVLPYTAAMMNAFCRDPLAIVVFTCGMELGFLRPAAYGEKAEAGAAATRAQLGEAARVLQATIVDPGVRRAVGVSLAAASTALRRALEQLAAPATTAAAPAASAVAAQNAAGEPFVLLRAFAQLTAAGAAEREEGAAVARAGAPADGARATLKLAPSMAPASSAGRASASAHSPTAVAVAGFSSSSSSFYWAPYALGALDSTRNAFASAVAYPSAFFCRTDWESGTARQPVDAGQPSAVSTLAAALAQVIGLVGELPSLLPRTARANLHAAAPAATPHPLLGWVASTTDALADAEAGLSQTLSYASLDTFVRQHRGPADERAAHEALALLRTATQLHALSRLTLLVRSAFDRVATSVAVAAAAAAPAVASPASSTTPAGASSSSSSSRLDGVIASTRAAQARLHDVYNRCHEPWHRVLLSEYGEGVMRVYREQYEALCREAGDADASAGQPPHPHGSATTFRVGLTHSRTQLRSLFRRQHAGGWTRLPSLPPSSSERTAAAAAANAVASASAAEGLHVPHQLTSALAQMIFSLQTALLSWSATSLLLPLPASAERVRAAGSERNSTEQGAGWRSKDNAVPGGRQRHDHASVEAATEEEEEDGALAKSALARCYADLFAETCAVFHTRLPQEVFSLSSSPVAGSIASSHNHNANTEAGVAALLQDVWLQLYLDASFLSQMWALLLARQVSALPSSLQASAVQALEKASPDRLPAARTAAPVSERCEEQRQAVLAALATRYDPVAWRSGGPNGLGAVLQATSDALIRCGALALGLPSAAPAALAAPPSPSSRPSTAAAARPSREVERFSLLPITVSRTTTSAAAATTSSMSLPTMMAGVAGGRGGSGGSRGAAGVAALSPQTAVSAYSDPYAAARSASGRSDAAAAAASSAGGGNLGDNANALASALWGTTQRGWSSLWGQQPQQPPQQPRPTGR